MERLTRTGRRRQPPAGSGICDAGYHAGRQTKASLRYRLWRRTQEVQRAATRHLSAPPDRILDVGTADALMLSALREAWPSAQGVGLDLSMELLRASRDAGLSLVRGDAAALPVQPSSFDLVVATAIIEHVPDALAVLLQIHHALRPGGLLVLTSPDPFWEHLATLVGHLPDEQHHETMDLPRLATCCECARLRVLETRRFMLSPVGLPREQQVEALVRRAGLGFLFANQLVAAVRR